MTEPIRDSLPGMLARAQAGERRATGRLLSIVERGGEPADALATLTHPHTGHAHVVGITGAPGAGKSTLTGALAASLAAAGSRVAIVAIDPSSPITGGAILGDRIRMDDIVASAHERIFIRSMATRGQHGGLALAVPGALRVLDAAAFDVVVVETAGVGQIEIDIVAETDTTVVVLNPGWGDAIQANKAGVMEMADVFVVNKADRPGTDDAVRDIEYMLDLGRPHARTDGHSAWRPPIVCAVATEGRGIDTMIDALTAHLAHLELSGGLTERRTGRLDNEVRRRVRQAFELELARAVRADPTLLAAVRSRRLSPADAAQLLADRVLR
jgi:LAO/AO transport system kinase